MSIQNDDYYQQRLNRMRADVRDFVQQIQSTLESLTRRIGVEGTEDFSFSQAGKGTTPISSAKVPTDFVNNGTQTIMYDQQTDQDRAFASASHTVHGSPSSAGFGTQTILYEKEDHGERDSYSSPAQTPSPKKHGPSESQTVLYDNEFNTDRLSRLKDMIANQLSSGND